MATDGARDQQQEFFSRARREATAVTIYLTNGKKLSGKIKGFDRFTVLVNGKDVDQLIFKHAISTVAIGRPSRHRPPDES